jgi:hypothetical protein
MKFSGQSSLAAVLAGLAIVMTAAPAAADTLTWRVRSEYPYRVQLEFYSTTRSAAWPGDGQAYDLNDSATHTYHLECYSGEKICYGAWVTGDSTKYWGAGYGGTESCTACCYVCGAGETDVIVLRP